LKDWNKAAVEIKDLCGRVSRGEVSDLKTFARYTIDWRDDFRLAGIALQPQSRDEVSNIESDLEAAENTVRRALAAELLVAYIQRQSAKIKSTYGKWGEKGVIAMIANLKNSAQKLLENGQLDKWPDDPSQNPRELN
jgi:hypothetical protein